MITSNEKRAVVRVVTDPLQIVKAKAGSIPVGYGPIITTAQNTVWPQTEFENLSISPAGDIESVISIGHILCICGKAGRCYCVVGSTVNSIRPQAYFKNLICIVIRKINSIIKRIDRDPGRLV